MNLLKLPGKQATFYLPGRLVWLLVFLVPLSAVAGYKIKMVSGMVHTCEEKYEIDRDGLVNFRLTSGAGMAVPKDKIDWYATAILNGEKPTAKQKKIAGRENTSDKKSLQRDRASRKSGKGGSKEDRDRERREIIKKQPLWNDFAKWGTGPTIFLSFLKMPFGRVIDKYGLLAACLIFLFAFLGNCLVFWGALNIFGEDVTFAHCAWWLLGISIVALLVFFPLRYAAALLGAAVDPAMIGRLFLPIVLPLMVVLYFLLAWFLGKMLDCKMFSVVGALFVTGLLGKMIGWGMAVFTS